MAQHTDRATQFAGQPERHDDLQLAGELLALTDGKWPLDVVLVTFSRMTIRREWQVQGDAIRSSATNTRPSATFTGRIW